MFTPFYHHPDMLIPFSDVLTLFQQVMEQQDSEDEQSRVSGMRDKTQCDNRVTTV
jgi:hypothetical protein